MFLASVTSSLTTNVREHGLYAVFVLMAIDAVLPAASELVMVVGGAVAAGAFGASFSLLPPDNASGNFVKVVQRVPVRVSWNGPPADQVPVGSSAEVTVYTK